MTDDPLRATISLRGVLFTPDDDVLLVERASDGEWELPGGRLDPGEDPLDGLSRELYEETALSPAVGRPVHTMAWENDENNGRFATFYCCYAERGSVTLSPEHTDYRWATPAEAEAKLSRAQNRAVERARDARKPISPAADADRAADAEGADRSATVSD